MTELYRPIQINTGLIEIDRLMSIDRYKLLGRPNRPTQTPTVRKTDDATRQTQTESIQSDTVRCSSIQSDTVNRCGVT